MSVSSSWWHSRSACKGLKLQNCQTLNKRILQVTRKWVLLFTLQVCYSFIFYLLLCSYVLGVNVQIPSAGRHFFFLNTYSSGSPGRQVTVGAEERLPSRLCTRPAGDSSACVTKTPWRIPTCWRAHQTRASDWFLVECESALRSDNRLRGHIPQTKCLLCSPLRNLGDAPTKRLQHKTHDKFFFIWQMILSCRAVLVWCQWVHKKKKILEGSSWFLVNDLVWLKRNNRPIKSRKVI